MCVCTCEGEMGVLQLATTGNYMFDIVLHRVEPSIGKAHPCNCNFHALRIELSAIPLSFDPTCYIFFFAHLYVCLLLRSLLPAFDYVDFCVKACAEINWLIFVVFAAILSYYNKWEQESYYILTFSFNRNMHQTEIHLLEISITEINGLSSNVCVNCRQIHMYWLSTAILSNFLHLHLLKVVKLIFHVISLRLGYVLSQVKVHLSTCTL